MRVFVTGGTGFIGRQLVQRLLKDGHEVFVLVRTSATGEALRQAGAQLLVGDLSDDMRLLAAVRGVDRVYHCAALTGFWGIPWKELYEVNVLGTEALMNACTKTRCPNVVHISTAFVYGFCRDARPRTEPDQAGTALPPYERSKWESEKIVLAHVRDEGLNAKIVRLTSVYGSEGRLIPMLVDGLMRHKVKIIGNGNNKKHIIHIDDCVDGIIAAAERGRAGGIYNIGAADVPTMREIVEEVARALGIGIPGSVPRGVARTLAFIQEARALVTNREPQLTRYAVDYLSLHQSCDITRAVGELNFSPKIRYQDGIASAVQRYLHLAGSGGAHG